MELRERGKGQENDRASVISRNIICVGRGYKDVCALKAVEKWREWKVKG
jgi:hypothetical protein